MALAVLLFVFFIIVILIALFIFPPNKWVEWFVKKDKTDLVEDDGFQQSALEYPGLPKDEIFEAVDRFYRTYYLRPKPILRIIKTMLEDKDVFVRRCREGFEFFKSLRQRKVDLEASRGASIARQPATA